MKLVAFLSTLAVAACATPSSSEAEVPTFITTSYSDGELAGSTFVQSYGATATENTEDVKAVLTKVEIWYELKGHYINFDTDKGIFKDGSKKVEEKKVLGESRNYAHREDGFVLGFRWTGKEGILDSSILKIDYRVNGLLGLWVRGGYEELQAEKTIFKIPQIAGEHIMKLDIKSGYRGRKSGFLRRKEFATQEEEFGEILGKMQVKYTVEDVSSHEDSNGNLDLKRSEEDEKKVKKMDRNMRQQIRICSINLCRPFWGMVRKAVGKLPKKAGYVMDTVQR